MTQLVVGEDVLLLLYQVSAGLHCVGLNFPVPVLISTWRESMGGEENSMQGQCLLYGH